MLGQLAKTSLTLTSLAPLCVTWAFADWLTAHKLFTALQVGLLITTAALVLLCWLVLKSAKQQVATQKFAVTSIKQADSEIVSFLVAYLLPLGATVTGNFDACVLVYGAIILFVVVSTSHAYSFNPFMTVLRYHFYEVSNIHGVTYLLITKRTLKSVSEVTSVHHLTAYLVMDEFD